MKGNYTMPKINPISALPIRKVTKSSTKQTKNVANQMHVDLSYEEQGFFKYGNKFVKMIFPS